MSEPARGQRPVVYFSTTHDWHSYDHFYQGLARSFATSRPVLYVGSVTTLQADELAQVSENIWSLNVRVPSGAGRYVLRPLRDRLLARAVRRSIADLKWTSPPMVWTFTTDAAPYIRQTPAATSVYWTGDEVLDKFEPALLRAVQHVFTVSPLATEQKRRLIDPERVTQMPIATDPAPYEAAVRRGDAPADLAALPRPWFGYGGSINHRTDWDLMRELARRTCGSVVVVGPAINDEGRRQVVSPENPPNLIFLGHRDADVAPNYIAAFDVGLIPYALIPFNLGSNPVKTYDYLAAGRPVVATDLPALHPLAPHVAIAKDEDEFIRMALDAAAAPMSGATQRQALAREYSYDALVARIDEVLGVAALVP